MNDTDRDPTMDHPEELYPDTEHVEDRSDVLQVVGARPQERRVEQVVGDNVDDDGVAHFLRVTEDGDVCGGCGVAWPCQHRVPLQVQEVPHVDPDLLAAVMAELSERHARTMSGDFAR